MRSLVTERGASERGLWTPQTLFADVPLVPTASRSWAFSPCGRWLTCLRESEDQRDQWYLWRYDRETGAGLCLIDDTSGWGLPDHRKPTAAELADRERRRSFGTGVNAYVWRPDGRELLIPAAGHAFAVDPETAKVSRRTPANTQQTDFAYSGTGRYLSFVRDSDLYFCDDAGVETRVTHDGSATVQNGIPDFIAQEEMHRFDAHWWSPDDAALAFCRSDASPIDETLRYEMDSDGLHAVPQRYPFAGGPNAEVVVCVYALDTQQTLRLESPFDGEWYVARVQWFGKDLTVQWQNRAQTEVRLCVYGNAAGSDDVAARVLWVERADTWVELHDNLCWIPEQRAFLWTSEADGRSQVYMGDATRQSSALRQLTTIPGRVDEICCVRDGTLWFAGWDDTPTERHLFRTSLDGSGQIERLSKEAGWHELVFERDGTDYVLCRSALDAPQVVTLHRGDNCIELLRVPVAGSVQSQLTIPELGALRRSAEGDLHYRLTVPAGDAPVPAIVYVYGGPGVQRVRNEWAPLLLQLFVAAGFAVFELDNRGSTNRSYAFTRSIYRRLGRVEVEDQIEGAAWLQAHPRIDSARIGVFGHSYGGYMVLKLLCGDATPFTAGVAAAPVTEWALYDTHYTERYLGMPRDNTDGYAASDVLPEADRLHGELLLLHGMADDNVLFTHSVKLMDALQRAGIDFSLMTYPGSKHALQESHVATHRFDRILDFFREHLQ